MSGQFSQAAFNTPFTAQQPLHHFSNSTLYTPPASVTRHGGAAYASAIPSGSQDLPEGVSIPPGWSLLPLQRLDSQPSQQHTGPQPIPTTSSHDFHYHQHHTTAQFSRNIMGHHPNSVTGFPTPAADTHSATRNSDAQSGTDRNPESSSSRVQREPPNVAAPTPVIPQWGGPLLGNRGSPSTTPATGVSNSRHENIAGTGLPAADSSDSDGDESVVSSGKGKAKAATVEDVEEGSD
ncbi:hypothetical protein NUW58_g9649 [Xylaria curta]|uniref:Uncharacterized protein n=1 Tax=Xylaria curta TaxID=42375 RepID=A0ACC1MW31_9PEZI|nr:hypothetical protein NUW58_g9649 [Xylaria curta]